MSTAVLAEALVRSGQGLQDSPRGILEGDIVELVVVVVTSQCGRHDLWCDGDERQGGTLYEAFGFILTSGDDGMMG